MSAAVHRSERHGSINWRRKGGEETLHHTVSKADFEVGTGLRKSGPEDLSLLTFEKRNLFKKAQTFSTRSMKKSLTSFVWVNFAAMLTRPLERFYKKTKRITFKKY